jgi:DNA-binding transcriptional regulator YhcF (GntR family)
MTISKAYSYLEKENVVERRPGRPLIVRDLTGEAMTDQRMHQLRESLTASVRMARQLEIDREEALKLFREMLDTSEEDADERR